MRGYFGARKNVWTVAKNTWEKGLTYAYRDRKNKKRTFRALWIQRINAAARQEGMSYSVLMGKLAKAGIEINRKVLADLRGSVLMTLPLVLLSLNRNLDLRSRFLTFGSKNELLLLSLNRNLVNTFLMATAFELRSKVLVHNLAGRIFIDETSGHNQYVGIVVLTNQMCNFGNPTETCTNRLVFIERHVDTLTTAADGNTWEYFALLNTLSQRMTEVAIVARILRIRAIVLILVSFLFQILLHFFTNCFSAKPAWSLASPIIFVSIISFALGLNIAAKLQIKCEPTKR